MPSQTVLRFQTASESVIASAAATADEVALSLAQVFDPLLAAGEPRVDWALVQKLASRRLSEKSLRLAEVDERLELARTGDKELRQQRNELVKLLRGELRSVRLLLDEKVGREVSAGLFRWRNPSQLKPSTLVVVARETAVALRASSLLDAAKEASGAFAAPGEIAAALENRAGELGALLDDLGPKRKRQTFDVGEKSQEWQEAYSARLRSQDLLYGLYRAAGKDHLAQRLRPKTRAAAPASEAPMPGKEANPQA